MAGKFAEKVTREELEEAMRMFFDKGGKITKVQGAKPAGDHYDPNEAFEDSSSFELNHIVGLSLEP
ncbi:MAG: hypothetical protein HQM11_06385 [SAR324 cluster bacterium]|nr:hypothetical protein [SAR324 cluster bacterium]